MSEKLTPDEVREVIVDARREDWEFFDAPPTKVLKTNRDISIRLLNRYPQQDREIDQPDWASALPNPTSHKNTLRVEYRGAPIDQLPVRQLDEFRVTMVAPDTDYDASDDEHERILTEYEAKISEVMSSADFGANLNRLDVRIVED